MKYLVAVCSAIIWGSGQFLNKQKLKAIVPFALMLIFVSIELLTSPALKTANWNMWEIADRFDLTVFFQCLSQELAAFRNWGFFVKGIWGLVTLGTVARVQTSPVFDHSVMLLLGGLLAAVAVLIFAAVWVWNIMDAYKTRKKMEAGIQVSSGQYFKTLWDRSFEYIMISPGLLLVILISLIPIIFSILIAFTNYNVNAIPPRNLIRWRGFETFANIVSIRIWGSTLVQIFIWTVIWAFLATFTAYSFGFFQALILRAKAVKFRSFWRGIFILPWAVPALVSQLIFRVLLNREGAFNQMLLGAGIIETAIPFLSHHMWAKVSLVLVNVWLGFPYFMVLISGVMTTIPTEQFEASQIDGANVFQQFRFITLPFILSATAPQILMSLTFNFNNFGMIYFLTGGGPANPNFQMAGSTDILISWIFKLTLDQRMYNYASALSIMVFIVIASVSAWNLLRTRAFKED
jgi:arabinogalactan oligomer/maltooligosaccharide transport system permease protein